MSNNYTASKRRQEIECWNKRSAEFKEKMNKIYDLPSLDLVGCSDQALDTDGDE
jgi:hypothetical protein